jgi:cell division protein FtsI (penicillin-binding protein 3)
MLKRETSVQGEQIMSEQTARQVRDMLEQAVSRDGTGVTAQVAYYRIGGKTGTAHKLMNGEYAKNSYIASFAGFAPASNPRLVMIVMIDEPQGSAYYGGQVAAPVFSKVMAGALRLLNIPPDRLNGPERRTAELARAGVT